MPERISKLLSSHGLASRREAERMILAGRVIVNGIPAKIGQSAQYGIDVIEVDGVPLAPLSDFVYIMLNKPRGYVTTMRDDRGRKTVMDLIEGVGLRVYPIGRLDINTSGLLLFTNDGQYANKITHPSYMVHKTYEATVSGDVLKGIDLLNQPIDIDGHLIQAVSVERVDLASKHNPQGRSNGIVNTNRSIATLMVTVNEGRNRQLRKMCSHAGLLVRRLKRISIGDVSLGSLEAGRWRHLTIVEKRSLES